MSHEEIHEEIDYQKKWGEDPRAIKADDEHFTARELERPITAIKRVWTEEKQRSFDSFWKDYRWLLEDMAKKRGEILTEEHFRLAYERHIRFWKSAWEDGR